MTLLVGICGPKRAGKDTVAAGMLTAFTTDKYKADISICRRAFADTLKEEVAEFLAAYTSRTYTEAYRELTTDGPEKEVHRKLLQFWGTEFRRTYCGEDYWIEQHKQWLIDNPNNDIVLIPDVRFYNEIEYILSNNGVIVGVYRPGLDNDDQHISEIQWRGYTDWDCVFVNDSSKSALEDLAREAITQIYKQKVSKIPGITFTYDPNNTVLV